ncbi:DNA methyltransferase [Candidatus Harpocratesius sp.]
MKIKNPSNLGSKLDFDYVVIPKTHTSMYLMHKYWARKPANIVSEYIRRYTKPGEIVLDPFMGSGVTILEAVFNHRKAIGIDINPISSFICKNTGVPINLKLLKEGFFFLENLIQQPNSLYSQLYHLSCPICHQSAEITHLVWQSTPKNKSNSYIPLENFIDTLIEIRFFCSTCGALKLQPKDESFSQYAHFISNLETSLHEKIKKNKEFQKLSKFFLDFKFQYQNQINFLQLRHSLRQNPDLSSLFSKRALLFLAWLRDKIEKLPVKFNSIKEILLFTLTAAVAQASKMVWVIDKRRGKNLLNMQVGSWTHHFFWNPNKYFEVNAWNCFKIRFTKILRGKQESNQRNNNCEIPFNLAPNLELFFKDTRYSAILINRSILHFDIPKNSVDFIFTDPPYGDSIQYGELSSLWVKWIGLDMEQYISMIQKEEIVINSKQQKNLQFYQSKLSEAFKILYKVLKPGKFMVVTFHNTSINIRNALITSVLEAGFELKQILFQLPPRVSIKSMLHHSGTPIGDYYLRFQKLVSKSLHTYLQKYKETIKNTSYSEKLKIVKQIIVNILQKRGEPTYFIWITNLIDEFLYQKYLFPLLNFDDIIKELSKDSDFIITKDQKWWLTNPIHISKAAHPLINRITEFLYYIMKNDKKSSSSESIKQYYFNKIYERFRGVLTPDKYTINSLIQQKIQ